MQRPEENPESFLTFVSLDYSEQVLDKDIPTDPATFSRWLRDYVHRHREEAMPTARGYIRLDALTIEPADNNLLATISGSEYQDDELLSIMPPWVQRAVRPVVAEAKQMTCRYINVEFRETGNGIHVLVTCRDKPIVQYFHSLAQAIHNQWPDILIAPPMLPAPPAPTLPPPIAPVHSSAENLPPEQPLPDKKTGPTLRTRERFAAFKRLKDAHPEWSQDRVALEACKVLGEVVTGETVRNTYRLMGQKWPRGDRAR